MLRSKDIAIGKIAVNFMQFLFAQPMLSFGQYEMKSSEASWVNFNVV